jgi:hypothetical protein
MAGFEIKVKAGETAATSSVQATGSLWHVITDAEVGNFGLSDDALKTAVDKNFGRRPNDAYLKSPTPWNDLYKTYGWEQVTTRLDVQSAVITGLDMTPTIISSKEFVNNSGKAATFNAAISDSVTNTTENQWSSSGSVEVGQVIKYEIGFLGTGGGGETSMKYTQSWGQNKSESVATTVGSTSGVEVLLQPGEGVKAVLTANRGTLKIRVTYNVYLTGNTAINYNPTFKDHHFWALGITGVMSSGGIRMPGQVVEDIQVGYYSNDRIELHDLKSKAVLYAHPFAAMSGGIATRTAIQIS